jgi:hypothetical protein
MSKRYALGVKRYVSVRKQDGELTVTIAEDGSEKSAILPARRWVRFVAAMNDAEESLKQMLAKQYVKFNQHVGGGWYLSVTTGYLCVDLRRWYYDVRTNEIKPSKTGIALRINEWNALKDVIQQIHQKYPALSTTQTCTSQPDHYNLEGAISCFECNPFQLEEMLSSMNA